MVKMFRKFFLFITIILIPMRVYSASPWEGEWLYGRYSIMSGGSLSINNCKNNVCDFEIMTSTGAHGCSLDGKLKINGNKAQYIDQSRNSRCSDGKTAIIQFNLDSAKQIIDVENISSCGRYCGVQGNYLGKYENENNPLRFDTGFDCWKSDLSDTEKTICSTRHLAQADKEISTEHPEIMTDDWKAERDKCNTKVDCLWDYYISSLKKEYRADNKPDVDIYKYMNNPDDDKLYYPMDYVLLDDYFRKNMEDKYYQELIISFGYVAMGINQCQNCYYHQYGIAGLFAWYSSSFYINNKNEIWIAFVSANLENPEDEEIIVFAPPGNEEKDMPEKIKSWVDHLLPYKKGIRLKYFFNKISDF